MALTKTSLSSNITDSALDIPVVSSTGATAGKPMLIDHEYMAVVEVVTSTLVKVRTRGDKGTQAVAHNALAAVIFGTGEAGEFPTHPVAASGQIPPHFNEHVTYGVSGAIAVPIEDTDAVINKAGVAVMTLAAPNKAQNGLRLSVKSNTAFAHTVTATGLFKTGAATVNLATFAAFAGAGFEVMAQDGLWIVMASVGVTFT
jgi:hypothetical protein